MEFWTIFAAFLVFFAKSTIVLLKKLATGKLDAHFSEMDIEMRTRAFPICLGLGCAVFPIFFTLLAFRFLNVCYVFAVAFFFLTAFAIFHLLAGCSDLLASKRPVADNELRRASARRARQLFLFIFGLLSLAASAVSSWFFLPRLPASF